MKPPGTGYEACSRTSSRADSPASGSMSTRTDGPRTSHAQARPRTPHGGGRRTPSQADAVARGLHECRGGTRPGTREGGCGHRLRVSRRCHPSLLRCPTDTPRHILPRHEQAAVFAADAYARVTGKVGVCGHQWPRGDQPADGNRQCDGGLGPPGRADRPGSQFRAGHGRLPGSRHPRHERPVVKRNRLVRDPQQVPQAVHEAFQIARTGRPGPVLLDLPKDVLLGACTATAEPWPVSATAEPEPVDLEAAPNSSGRRSGHWSTPAAVCGSLQRRVPEGLRLSCLWSAPCRPAGAMPADHPCSWGCSACTVSRRPTMPSRNRTCSSSWVPGSMTG